MPRAAENLHAFDLRMLKALLNLKLNGNHNTNLSTGQLENLTKQMDSKNGKISLSPSRFVTTWNKDEEILRSIQTFTLNELCKILNVKFTWNTFSMAMIAFRPKGINQDIPLASLTREQQHEIENTVESLISPYQKFEDFEDAVLLHTQQNPISSNAKAQPTDSHQSKLPKENIETNIKQNDSQNDVIELNLPNNRNKKILILSSICLFVIIFFIYFLRKTNITKVESKNISVAIPNNNYKVLILPFQPLEECKYKETNIEHTIVNRLNDLNHTQKLNLEIILDTTTCIHNYQEADSIGSLIKADLVIWGDLYEHCSSSNEACLKFVNISSRKFLKESGKNEDSFSSLLEIYNGKLQKDVDYIIYWVAGNRSINERNYKAALKFFHNISDKADDVVYTSMGIAFKMLNENDSSKLYFEKALLYNKFNFEANSNYANLLGYVYHNYDKSKQLYESALKINPNDEYSNYYYANLLDLRFHDIRNALIYYQNALTINPQNVYAAANMAGIFQRIKNYESAIQMYKYALSINPNVSSINHVYALMLMEMPDGDLHASEYYFQKSIELKPQSWQYHYNFGAFYKYIGDKTKSKIQFDEAARLNPDIKNKNVGGSEWIEGFDHQNVPPSK
jgi:tetratricopeptide (TPR) repeat protein